MGLQVDDLVWAQPSSTSGLGWVLSQAWGSPGWYTGYWGILAPLHSSLGLRHANPPVLTSQQSPRCGSRSAKVLFQTSACVRSINIPLITAIPWPNSESRVGELRDMGRTAESHAKGRGYREGCRIRAISATIYRRRQVT